MTRNILRIALFALFALLAGAALPAATALAAHPDTQAEIDNLKRRIETLEAQNKSAEDQPFTIAALGRMLTLSGLLELEGVLEHPEGGDTASDLALATAELGLQVEVNSMIGGHLLLLWDDETDDLEVDEAVITLTGPAPVLGQTAKLHGGRLYVPFGSYRSAMISDPLTLELGETRDTALLLALEGPLWTATLGAFNGAVDAAGDSDTIDSWVASLEITPHEAVSFGVSLLSDQAESGAGLVTDAALYDDSVPGAAAFVSLQQGNVTLEAEYLSAVDQFDQAVVDAGEDLTGRRPRAWNLELAWQPLERLQLAARTEQARDFQNDVRRWGATVSYGLHDHLVVALEYINADAKGPDGDPAHTTTAQLALEF